MAPDYPGVPAVPSRLRPRNLRPRKTRPSARLSGVFTAIGEDPGSPRGRLCRPRCGRGRRRENESRQRALGGDIGVIRWRHVRYHTRWPAFCRAASGSVTWTTWITDHSSGGFGLESCPLLRVDEPIEIELEQLGTFHGRVAWQTNERCGVELLPEGVSPSDADLSSLAAFLGPAVSA